MKQDDSPPDKYRNTRRHIQDVWEYKNVGKKTLKKKLKKEKNYVLHAAPIPYTSHAIYKLIN